MKSTLLSCTLVFLWSVFLQAQEPALPNSKNKNRAAESSPSPEALSPLPTPLPQLVPPDILPLSERVASPAPPGAKVSNLPQLDEGFKASPVNAAAEANRRQFEWRELRNRVANDQDLKAKLKLAETASTDLDRRKLLRSYYEAYFRRMDALAATPEMKVFLQDQKTRALASLAQPRVRPDASLPSKRKS